MSSFNNAQIDSQILNTALLHTVFMTKRIDLTTSDQAHLEGNLLMSLRIRQINLSRKINTHNAQTFGECLTFKNRKKQATIKVT